MTVIKYNQLDDFLAEDGNASPLYLIFGEEYLRQTSFQKLTAHLIPRERREFDLDILEGTENNLYPAIEQLNTYALDSSVRVIGFCDSTIFYSSADSGKLVRQIKDALAEDDPRQAGVALMKLLALMDLDISSLSSEDKQQVLRMDSDPDDKSPPWLDLLIDYCRTSDLPAPPAADPAASLQKAVEKGFAPGNHLIITTDVVDKRRKLYKAIKEHGHIIDCTVAAGDSRAAREAQQAAIKEMTASILNRHGKKLAPDALKALCELTGFDLRTINSSLEKLAAYTDSRQTITVDDVHRLSKRTRTDPIYALTNAVFSKDTRQSLFYLENLLSGTPPIYPAQIIVAVLNQTRKLSIIRDFVETDGRQIWKPDLRFDAFRRNVLPAVEKYDAETAERISARDQALEAAGENKKKSKSKPAAELIIAPDTNNPYPVFKNFEKAGNFSRSELLSVFTALQKADRQLKRTSEKGPTSRLILEQLIMEITTGAGENKKRFKKPVTDK